MLRQLRSEKVMKSIMVTVIAIVVPSFVVFYGWQAKTGRNRAGIVTGPAASIKFAPFDKVEIAEPELQQAKGELKGKIQEYARTVNINVSPATIERLADSPGIVREAVNLELLQRFAKQHGITVSDEEVGRILDQIPPQQREYVKRSLEQQGKTIDMYAMELQTSLLFNKIRQLLASQTRISYYEAWLEFLRQKEKLVADYVRFNVSDYAEKVKVDEPELKKYFEANQEQFRIPDQVEYAYLLLRKDDLRSSVTVTKDDITSYYAAHREEFRLPDKAHVRQIMLAKPQRSDYPTSSAEEITSAAEQVSAKANEVYQRLVKGEDFAALADQFNEERQFPVRPDEDTTASEEVTTAGGNLGWVPEPTARAFYGDDWTSAVFHMKEGSISPPIETPRGVSIPKLEALRPGTIQPIDKVENVVKDKIIAEKVEPVFQKRLQDLREKAQAATTLEQLAAETSLTVEITGKVDRSAKFIPRVGPLGEFQEAVSELAKGGRSEVLSDNNRLLVMEVREEFPAHVPALDEARDKIVDAFKRSRGREMARTDAEKLKSKSVNYDAMGTAAKDMGVTVTKSRPFVRSEVMATLGAIPDFAETSIGVGKGEIHLSPLGSADEPQGFVVWHLADKIEPARDEFAKEIPKLIAEMSDKKARIVVNEYLRDRWRELGSQIKISPAYQQP